MSRAFAVSRASLYAYGTHRTLRAHACWPSGVRPKGRAVYVPQSVVDAAIARVLLSMSG